ncbi:hypothetical protein ACHWGL_30740, partial [Klebsiella pneumoniae]|uniref:hypothetical protein n=1 Tax=Klebsiella pneumoniae TaxID=573 RepID=UPI00376EF64D
IDRKEAAEIATLCTECGVPQMAAGFIAGGLSLDDVKTRVSAIGTVHMMAATAERTHPGVTTGLAVKLLSECKTVPEIRTALFEAIVAKQDETEISSHIPLP